MQVEQCNNTKKTKKIRKSYNFNKQLLHRGKYLQDFYFFYICDFCCITNLIPRKAVNLAINSVLVG